MIKWTKQRAHLKKIRNGQKEDNNTKQSNELIHDQNDQHSDITIQCDLNTHRPKHSSKECAFAALASGLTLTQCKHFCTEMNEDFVSEKCFYEAQKQIEPVVVDYANESMANARAQSVCSSDGEIIVSGDGRYPTKKTRRIVHLMFLIVELIKFWLLVLLTKNQNIIQTKPLIRRRTY